MRVLVTGHRGYIGSVMVTVLRHARFEVVGLDCDLYEGCDFGRVRETVPSYSLDLRDVEFTDLLSFDAVVHLASMPDRASPELDSVPVHEINEEATVRLAECCKKASVSRFLFASSCNVYSRDDTKPFDEQGAVNPTAPDAASKLRCERELTRLADHTFNPVLLRNAEVYGVSPRMRTDLTVNELVASAVTAGHAILRSDGRAWRPVVHVEDLARAYAAVLTAADEAVHREVFNIVGHQADETGSDENYRMIDIADMVAELVPHCTRSSRRVVCDEPSYRAVGSRFRRAFPRFSFRWTLPIGIRQLHSAMVSAGMTPGELRSDRYNRAQRVRTLIGRGDVDSTLRRPESALLPPELLTVESAEPAVVHSA